jgi:Rap1a immunity proteins
MKKLGFLLFTASLFLAAECQAASNPSAQQVTTGCAAFIAGKTNGKYDTVAHLQQGESCQAYIKGVIDEMHGELAWGDDAHTKLVVGDWPNGIGTEQAVRVFVKYANDNPITLNQSATAVFRQSMEAAELYTYAAVTVGK